jgi:hypothetical protein
MRAVSTVSAGPAATFWVGTWADALRVVRTIRATTAISGEILITALFISTLKSE